MIPEDVRKSVDNICKNYGIVAGLHMSVPLQNCENLTTYSTFIDINVGSHFDIHNQELLRQIAQEGVLSKKDYRRLRNLIRFRLINAIRSIQDLATDSLRNLGVEDK